SDRLLSDRPLVRFQSGTIKSEIKTKDQNKRCTLFFEKKQGTSFILKNKKIIFLFAIVLTQYMDLIKFLAETAKIKFMSYMVYYIIKNMNFF
ncbi:MAG: hypothetical protein RSD26_03920, partial [Cellulosilyticaceae bacterium]